MAPQLSEVSPSSSLSSTPSLSSSAVSTPTFTPALAPPPGVVSNPDHPDSLVHLADVAIGICIPLVSIFYILRCYVRIFIKRVWIFEDYLVTVACAGTIAYCGIMRATMSHHGGQHGWDITPAQFHEASYWFNVAAIEYGIMIGLAKLAVLWLYRRVFSPIRWSAFDILIVILIVLIIGFYGSTSIVKIFECYPRDKIWNKDLPGKCVQMKWILNISGGFNTVTDYIILLLPVHAVLRLRMDRFKRVLVVLAFTFGLCAPIFATIGFVVRLRNSGNQDTSWDQPEILLWGAAELASGNLCVCFPELAVLFRKRNRRRRRGGFGPRRPTTSELQAWRDNEGPHRRGGGIDGGDDASGAPLSHPYFTKSLMGMGTTTFSSNAFSSNSTAVTSANAGDYIELQDQGGHYDVHITPMSRAFSRAGRDEEDGKPEDGVILLRNEVRVEHQERQLGRAL